MVCTRLTLVTRCSCENRAEPPSAWGPRWGMATVAVFAQKGLLWWEREGDGEAWCQDDRESLSFCVEAPRVATEHPLGAGHWAPRQGGWRSLTPPSRARSLVQVHS